MEEKQSKNLPADSKGESKAKSNAESNADSNAESATENEFPEIDPDITQHDLKAVLLKAREHRGTASHHIDSMDAFYKRDMRDIVLNVFKVENRFKNERNTTTEDQNISEIEYSMEFKEVYLERPTTIKYKSGKSEPLKPSVARLNELTYSLQMSVDAELTAIAHMNDGTTKIKRDFLKNYHVANIPCMVGSSYCITHMASPEMKMLLNEDPCDPGGYFIIKGNEWAIDCLENITNNMYQTYNNSYNDEQTRQTSLDKFGDGSRNSFQRLIRLYQNGALTVEITTTIKDTTLEIPFYIVFRMLGLSTELEIADHIVRIAGGSPDLEQSLEEKVRTAFEAPYKGFEALRTEIDPIVIATHIAKRLFTKTDFTAVEKNVDAFRHIINRVYAIFDRFLLSQIGSDPADRPAKTRVLGDALHTLLCVNLRVMEQTNRHALTTKRITPAGAVFTKTFKTVFNLGCIQKIKNTLAAAFKQNSFSDVQMVPAIKPAIDSTELEKMLMQAITVGEKQVKVGTQTYTNRMSTQTLYRKNELNMISVLNTINTPTTSSAKQNENADQMRRVQSTYIGYIDLSQSADTGEKVGMTKQLAYTAMITLATNSDFVRSQLVDSGDVIPSLKMPIPLPAEYSKYARVYVNGVFLGYTPDLFTLSRKYIQMRRDGQTSRQLTIVENMNTRQLYFWCDAGRIIRPLLIVYNNFEEHSESLRKSKIDNSTKVVPFRQWIKLTKKHIEQICTGRMNLDDLIEAKIMEYISAEEQLNCCIAEQIDLLRKYQNDPLRQFTHCEITQAVFGVVALGSPLLNHSNSIRISFFTNHLRQAGSWYTAAYPYRIDRNTLLQWYCDRSLMTTMGDFARMPIGQTVMVATFIQDGRGCEDSVIVNRSSVDCGMYNASFYTNEKTKIKKGEQFGNPNLAQTINLRKDANYKNIQDGFVRENTRVKQNDVLIVKTAQMAKKYTRDTGKKMSGEVVYSDLSILYRRDAESSTVERVIKGRNQDDQLTAKVKLRMTRPIGVGDKLCLTSNHEIWDDENGEWISISNARIGMQTYVSEPSGLISLGRVNAVFKYPVESTNLVQLSIQTDTHEGKTTMTENHRVPVCIDGNFQILTAIEIIQHLSMGKTIFAYTICHINVEGVQNYLQPVGKIQMGVLLNIPMDVYCIQVDTGLFLTRIEGMLYGTGNSSRTGNKGIVSFVQHREDMPYTEDGMVPDLIVNVHSFPTRMALNQLIEAFLGNYGAFKGTHVDGTVFNQYDFNSINEFLLKSGLKPWGVRRMYNGRTGEPYDYYIFMGPTTYQRLLKFVLDEHYAVRKGAVNPLTHQPLDGKTKEGGLRAGEMEKDVLTAHGCQQMTYQKFYNDSDGCDIHICSNCGQQATVNPQLNIYICKQCGGKANIHRVSSSYVANLLMHELATAGIKMTTTLQPYEYDAV